MLMYVRKAAFDCADTVRCRHSPYGVGSSAGQEYRFWIRADFCSVIQGGQRPFDNPAGIRPGIREPVNGFYSLFYLRLATSE